MRKTTLAIITCIAGGAFVTGVAVGKAHNEPKYTAYEELKWDDLQGPKMAGITGDYKKGAYTGFLKIPGGQTSALHTHTGAYEAVQVLGSSSHWGKGEDGTKAKKMTPGSYWTMPAKLEHVSACAVGPDCVIFLMQKTKFDYKEAAKPADPKAGTGSAGTGSGAKAPEPAKTGTTPAKAPIKVPEPVKPPEPAKKP